MSDQADRGLPVGRDGRMTYRHWDILVPNRVMFQETKVLAQRAKPFAAGFRLEAQRALEPRRVELAAFDQDFANPLARGRRLLERGLSFQMHGNGVQKTGDDDSTSP